MIMRYSGLLGDFGLLGAALVELLGGEVDFEVSLEAELTLVLVNGRACGGGGRGGGARAPREPIDSNRSFAVMSNFRIVFTACETLRHILDFRYTVSCFGFG